MITIFDSLKSSYHNLGVSQRDEHHPVLSHAKSAAVYLILGPWAICFLTGSIVSNDLAVIVQSFLVFMNCSVTLVMFSYILYYKSTFFTLIDEMECSINESKINLYILFPSKFSKKLNLYDMI